MKLSDELPPRCRVFFWPLDGCPSLPSIATEIVFFQINAGGSDTSGGRRATERLFYFEKLAFRFSAWEISCYSEGTRDEKADYRPIGAERLVVVHGGHNEVLITSR